MILEHATPHHKPMYPIWNTYMKTKLNPILQITPSKMPKIKPSSTKPLPVTIAWNDPVTADA